ncbi:hypothetical protein C1645_840783 [Glomus cerebriforme]|uniref:Uncharacterized protein n=1 Tax=Glomus cerebriforme TaxID=658196 RepID=A0A397SAN6_9GLOM|nr:hypothetical protein C1645_840783 [Glomus cerebriforme]
MMLTIKSSLFENQLEQGQNRFGTSDALFQTIYFYTEVNNLKYYGGIFGNLTTNNSFEKILNIFVACLPNESKELLYKNGIIIPTPTSKPPLFN